MSDHIIVPQSEFPHNQIIEECKLKVSDFDDNLRTVITTFNKRYNDYLRHKKEVIFLELKATSTLISQNIYDYYVDKKDQETVITPDTTKKEVKEVIKEIKEEIKNPDPAPTPPTPAPEPKPADPTPAPPAPAPQENEPTNKNEKALYLIFKEGIFEGITISKLRENGFDTSSWGPLGVRGCRVGAYHLVKNFSDHVYKLSKV